MHNNRRLFKRENYQALIIYSEYEKIDYYQATMRNKSLKGISFESDTVIESRRPFTIIVPPCPGSIQIADVHQAYVAQLKWCKKCDTGCIYTIGAELKFQSNVLNEDKLYSASGYCDLCGNKLAGLVFKTNEPLYLCLKCFKYMGGMLKDDSRDSVMHFIREFSKK